jgi:hypothetical protein
MTTFAFQIRPSVQAELDAAIAAEAGGAFHTAFQHLERAHVLGQRATREHTRVHWHMLRFALRHRMAGEAVGQAWRVVAASIFTAFGLVPDGNTGGANVSGFRPLPMPDDLKSTIEAARAGAPARSGSSAVTRSSALVAFAALAVVAVLGSGCSTPADLDVSLDKASATGLYRVGLVPPAQAPAINQIHSWKVKLATADGAPVPGAKFAVDGGMPQHGHGLPTKPRVTKALGNGVYVIEGVRFNMGGWWEFKVAVAGKAGNDTVTFNLAL